MLVALKRIFLTLLIIATASAFAAPQPGASAKDKIIAPAQLASAAESESAGEPARALPIIASFVPGLVFHGSGHFAAGNYRAARDLIITEGVSVILVFAVGLPAFMTGNAAVLVPGVYTLGFVGVTHFFTSWTADFMGVSGLSTITAAPVNPHQRIWLAAGYIKQDDTESEIYGLYRFDGKFARENFFIRGLFDIEDKRTYQNFGLDTGYRVLRPKWADLYATFEARHEMSSEGFALTSVNGLAELTLYPSELTDYFRKSLKGIAFFTTVGLGRQYIHLRQTPNFQNDAYFANLILYHGARVRVTRYTELSSGYNFRKDNILGGAWILGGTFVHQAEVFLGNFFTRVTFEHGRGYRLFVLAGVNF